MKKISIILIILLLATLNSCFKLLGWEDFFKRAEQSREGRERRKYENSLVTLEEAQQQVNMWFALEGALVHGGSSLEKVRQYIRDGYDPNKSSGETWSDKTPLHIVAKKFYTRWWDVGAPLYGDIYRSAESRRLYGDIEYVPVIEELPDPLPDMEIFQLLVEAGADVNQWPYVWCRVYRFSRNKANSINLIRTGKPPQNREEREEFKVQEDDELSYFVEDANRVLEAFLKAGADPDRLGHPYPYSLEALRRYISDEEAQRHFDGGTRAINEAIKKGMYWESQVDLLLQYTTLDEDSLKAARASKDRAMIEKITRLWNEQNAR